MYNISWHVQNYLHMPVYEDDSVYRHKIFLKDTSKSIMYIKGYTRTQLPMQRLLQTGFRTGTKMYNGYMSIDG